MEPDKNIDDAATYWKERAMRAEQAMSSGYHVQRLLAHNQLLSDELEDWRASAIRAAEEDCGDSKHCTCVGVLRVRLAAALKRIGDTNGSNHGT